MSGDADTEITKDEITVEDMVAAMLAADELTEDEIEEIIVDVEPVEGTASIYLRAPRDDDPSPPESDEFSPDRDDDGTGVADE